MSGPQKKQIAAEEIPFEWRLYSGGRGALVVDDRLRLDDGPKSRADSSERVVEILVICEIAIIELADQADRCRADEEGRPPQQQRYGRGTRHDRPRLWGEIEGLSYHVGMDSPKLDAVRVHKVIDHRADQSDSVVGTCRGHEHAQRIGADNRVAVEEPDEVGASSQRVL